MSVQRGRFLEIADIVSAFVPVDMQTGANNGQWVNIANFGRILAVLFKGIGTGGDDPVFTLNQAKDNAGGSSKGLNFITAWTKIGTQTGIARMTKVVQAAASTYTPTSAASQAIIAVEVRAEDLDVENGFNHVQLAIPDVGGNAQLGCGFYIALDPRFEGASLESSVA